MANAEVSDANSHLPRQSYFRHLPRQLRTGSSNRAAPIQGCGRSVRCVFIYNAVRSEFGRAWEDMAQADFGSLVVFLHARIRDPKLGRILGA